MKIRSGFVSNSSSTSFCIYGVYSKKCSDEAMKTMKGIQAFEEPYGDGSYIGVPLQECRDDETMGDFKKRVVELINSQAVNEFDPSEFSVCEESWYDG
jgi:hypothetical protein